VTQQYVAGELSLILGALQAAVGEGPTTSEVARLRERAERTPPWALRPVVRLALQVADASCWDSLNRGDVAAFARRAAVCTELWEFAVCARLLGEP
jgi:hypothetical protein